MSNRLIKKIGEVSESINAELSADIAGKGMYARGLSTEGFIGGYLEALRDVQGFVHGYTNASNRFAKCWKEPPQKDWQHMDTAPRNRFIELRGRIDTTRLKEKVYKACFNHHFGCFVTPKGNQVAATAWREVMP